MKSILNRPALRSYAVKVRERTITPEEVRDYIIKGGNLQYYQSYDILHDFFVGTPRSTILSYFVSTSILGESPPAGHLESLRVLLENGADPNLHLTNPGPASSPAYSAVQLAAYENDIEALKVLVTFGGDVNLACRDQTYVDGDIEHPPLALASNIATIEFLLAHGADLQFRDSRHENLIFRAIRNTDPSLVEYFINKGLSPYDRNDMGQTPLDLAKQKLASWRKNIVMVPNNTTSPTDRSYTERAQLTITGLEQIVSILSQASSNIESDTPITPSN